MPPIIEIELNRGDKGKLFERGGRKAIGTDELRIIRSSKFARLPLFQNDCLLFLCTEWLRKKKRGLKEADI